MVMNERSNHEPKGWYSRGYLPHFDGGDIVQFVTFRLFDSLPKQRIAQWKEEYRLLKEDENKKQVTYRIEQWLDRGEGCCWLKEPKIASLVQNTLLFFDSQRYTLHAWVIMPNHVHVLFGQKIGYSLDEVVRVWKSYSARYANRWLNRKGKFWQSDYYDRYIRDEKHFEIAKNYIETNPVKANLCVQPKEWKYSSATY